MEPLRDLSILKEWDKYVPSTTGYLSTPLDDPFDTDVWDLLECLERMKPKGAIAGAHILTEAPSPGIGIKDKILSLPISAQDFEFLLESEDAIAFGDEEVTFDWDKIKIHNASWSHAIDKGTSAAMQAAGIDRELWKKYIFGGLTIIDLNAGGAHSLDLRSMSNRHLATVFVVLPSARSSATFEARHQGLTFAHDLTTSALFAPHFLICYPGMESAELRTQGRMAYLMYRLYAGDDSDPLPPLLDDLSPGPRSDVAAAFAAWAHALANDFTGDGIPTGPILYHLDALYKGKDCLSANDSRVDVTSITNVKDRLVLAHLAPAAKHFGFKILLAHAFITQTSGFDGAYDSEDSELEYDKDDYELDNGVGECSDVYWVVTELNGRGVEDREMEDKLSEMLQAKVEEREMEDPFLNYHVDTDEFDEKELDVYPERFCRTTLSLNCHKRASFLIIAPTPASYVARDDLDDNDLADGGDSSDDDVRSPAKRRYVDSEDSDPESDNGSDDDDSPPLKRRRILAGPIPTQCTLEPLGDLAV